MRVISQSARRFNGTHKGASIEIEREPRRMPGEDIFRFYITVTWKDGGLLYDGLAPHTVTTMAQAKREACYGACLDKRPA